MAPLVSSSRPLALSLARAGRWTQSARSVRAWRRRTWQKIFVPGAGSSTQAIKSTVSQR